MQEMRHIIGYSSLTKTYYCKLFQSEEKNANKTDDYCYSTILFLKIFQKTIYKVKVAVYDQGWIVGDEVQVIQNSKITKHIDALTTIFMHIQKS